MKLARATISQGPFRWNRDAWRRSMPQYASLFDELPGRIGRSDVFAVDDPVDQFITAMVWGYGDANYGPWRTRRVLDNPNAIDVLRRVPDLLARGGALDAYQFLAGEGRLHGYGPAFGTKHLYFAGYHKHAGEHAPLILDKVVATWLTNHADLPLDPVPWQTATYVRYLDVMHTWAGELGCAPDHLEMAIFTA